jgi:hypothetical protein
MDPLRNHPSSKNRTHAICFCEDGDLLSQWRGYGQLGGGFALGFSSEAIFKIPESDDRGIYKISYEPLEQSSLVVELVEMVCNTTSTFVNENRLSGSSIMEVSTVAENYAFGVLSQYPLAFKSAAFCEEKEWREVAFIRPDAEIDFTVRRGLPVPYVKVEIPLSALHKVMIGPTLHHDAAKSSVRRLLDKWGANAAEICESMIPLRG